MEGALLMHIDFELLYRAFVHALACILLKAHQQGLLEQRST